MRKGERNQPRGLGSDQRGARKTRREKVPRSQGALRTEWGVGDGGWGTGNAGEKLAAIITSPFEMLRSPTSPWCSGLK